METRRIEFRGLTTDSERQMIYGSLGRRDAVDFIGFYEITPPTNSEPGGDTIWREELVIRQTVGENIGLKDKNGKYVFEGDIVNSFDEKLVVIYNSSMASWDLQYAGGDSEPIVPGEGWVNELEVIGNIHEHPHLLNA